MRTLPNPCLTVTLTLPAMPRTTASQDRPATKPGKVPRTTVFHLPATPTRARLSSARLSGHDPDGDPIYHLYLREIGQVELLTREEETRLAQQVREGNPEAREHMIKANLRLVVKIAKDYEGLGLPLLDLINEGNIGLMKAVERFDPDRGAKLSSYASFWIKQAIRRALSNHGKTIRLPVHVQDRLLHLHRAAQRLHDLLGRDPTDEELADELRLPPAKIRELRSVSQSTLSLDAPLSDDGSDTTADLLADDRVPAPGEQMDTEASLQLLRELIGDLDARELRVLEHRFGLKDTDERTLEEVSRDFGVTRERIRQIQNRALRKLREQMQARDPVSATAGGKEIHHD